MSEKITAELTFIEKFSNVIHELKAPKGQKNTFGKYNYRSAEDILEAVKPIAFKYGLIVNLTDTVKLIGERYYVEAIASITDGTKRFEATGLARESEIKKGMDDSQITGTASSYARKYALNGLFLIDDTKDADTNEYKQENEAKSNVNQNEPVQNVMQLMNKYKNEVIKRGSDINQVNAWICEKEGAIRIDAVEPERLLGYYKAIAMKQNSQENQKGNTAPVEWGKK